MEGCPRFFGQIYPKKGIGTLKRDLEKRSIKGAPMHRMDRNSK
jgi:hypothetical protein